MLTPFIELHGDRLNSDCRSIVGGVGFMLGKPVAIIGQQRVATAYEDSYHTYPDGLRKAQRIIKLATKFNLPLITLILSTPVLINISPPFSSIRGTMLSAIILDPPTG